VVELGHHLLVLLGDEGLGGPAKEKIGLVIFMNINLSDKNLQMFH